MYCGNCGNGSLGSVCPFCGNVSPQGMRALAGAGDDDSWWSGVKDALNPTPAIVEGIQTVDVANLPKAAAAVKAAIAPPAPALNMPFDVLGALKWILYGALALGVGFAGVKGYELVTRK